MAAIPAVMLGWTLSEVARDASVRQASDRTRDLAERGSKLITPQFLDQLGRLRNAAGKARHSAELDEPSAAHLVKQMSRTTSHSTIVALFAPDGRPLYSASSLNSAPLDGATAAAYNRETAAPAPIFLLTLGTAESAMPVVLIPFGNAPARNAIAVLLDDKLAEWLRDCERDKATVALAGRDGHLVLTTAAGAGILSELSAAAGSASSREDTAAGSLIVSRTKPAAPGYTLLVAQPRLAALASSRPDMALGWTISIGLVLVSVVIAAMLLRLLTGQARRLIQLKDENRALVQIERARSEMMATVSHNLRTPLSSLHVTISSLLEAERTIDAERVRAKARSAYEDTQIVDIGVRNLLEMSRLEGITLTNSEPADLTDIVSAALSRLEPRLEGWPVEFDFPPDPIMIECDQARIEIVIANLMENSIKYCPRYTRLSLRGEVRSGYALFSLVDEGPGIPPGQEEFIFDRFHRIPNSTAKAGTGLGLAICKAIIERHKGQIGVRNMPDGGAEFWFALPTLE